MSDLTLGGTCADCGYTLVQVPIDGNTVRTYHPWNSLPAGFNCPALIPIEGTDHLSLNVPADRFVFA